MEYNIDKRRWHKKNIWFKKIWPESRIKYLGYYTNAKITDQGTNVIICVVGLSNVLDQIIEKHFPIMLKSVSSNVHLIKNLIKSLQIKKIYGALILNQNFLETI